MFLNNKVEFSILSMRKFRSALNSENQDLLLQTIHQLRNNILLEYMKDELKDEISFDKVKLDNINDVKRTNAVLRDNGLEEFCYEEK